MTYLKAILSKVKITGTTLLSAKHKTHVNLYEKIKLDLFLSNFIFIFSSNGTCLVCYTFSLTFPWMMPTDFIHLQTASCRHILFSCLQAKIIRVYHEQWSDLLCDNFNNLFLSWWAWTVLISPQKYLSYELY
jgi:hypothetical protein